MLPIDTTQDVHTHSHYSDGTAPPGEMVRKAREKGLSAMAMTDHMPLPHATRYAMDIKALPGYRSEITALKARQPEGFTLNMGLEIEYIPRFTDWIVEITEQGWDLLLLSVHTLFEGPGHCLVNGREEEFIRGLDQLFKKDIKAMARAYFHAQRQGIRSGGFQIVGHLDVFKKHNVHNRFFNEGDDWYREEIQANLNTIKDAGMKMEINTAGLNHLLGTAYPSPWVVEAAQALDIPIVLGSDAHAPGSVGQFFHPPSRHAPSISSPRR